MTPGTRLYRESRDRRPTRRFPLWKTAPPAGSYGWPGSATGFTFAAPADNTGGSGDTESAQAQTLIEQHFPQQKGDTLTLAIHADGGVAAVRPRVERLVGAL